MKYLPEVQVMSAKSSVKNTENITNTIKISVRLLTTTPYPRQWGTLCMANMATYIATATGYD